MSYKKGQAALEFLTTYGWAFVVILVMIGALAYFGVLDPSRFLPNRCQFPSGLKCERYTLDSTTAPDVARFELTNNLPDPITVDSIKYSTDNANSWDVCTSDGHAHNSTTNETINRGAKGTLVCYMTNTTLTPNSKQKINFKLIYSSGSSYDPDFANEAFGEIYAEVR